VAPSIAFHSQALAAVAADRAFDAAGGAEPSGEEGEAVDEEVGRAM
jgi:hypothetical protein